MNYTSNKLSREKKIETASVSINDSRINTPMNFVSDGGIFKYILECVVSIHKSISKIIRCKHSFSQWMNEITGLSPKVTGTIGLSPKVSGIVYLSINWLDAHTHTHTHTLTHKHSYPQKK